jgi:hypothetical protein
LNVGAIAQSPTYGSGDRTWVFDDCFFEAFWITTPLIMPCKSVYMHGGAVACAFIMFRRCSALGFKYWHQASKYGIAYADMPIVGTGGGLALEPTAEAGS